MVLRMTEGSLKYGRVWTSLEATKDVTTTEMAVIAHEANEDGIFTLAE